MPMAMADKNAPSTIILPESSSASGVRAGFNRCRTNAATSAACAASVTAKPGTSLIGRLALNQYNGLATARSTVSDATTIERSAGRPSSASTSSKIFNIGKTASAPNTAPRSASAVASDGTITRTAFASAIKIG